MTNISKWWITIKISWVKHTAYRLNFFLQIIGPSLVFFFVKYNLWSSIYLVGQPFVMLRKLYWDLVDLVTPALIASFCTFYKRPERPQNLT